MGNLSLEFGLGYLYYIGIGDNLISSQKNIIDSQMGLISRLGNLLITGSSEIPLNLVWVI